MEEGERSRVEVSGVEEVGEEERSRDCDLKEKENREKWTALEGERVRSEIKRKDNGPLEGEEMNHTMEQSLETSKASIQNVLMGSLLVEEDQKEKEGGGRGNAPLGENRIVALECLWLEESETCESE